MSENIPLEQVVQELQMVAQQLVSVQTQVRELQGTIDYLANQIEGNSVFQQVGPLLVEVDDIDVLSDSLAETCKQLNGHAEKLSMRESELRSVYEAAAKKFESA
ncbi:MAG: prefoldin subunit [Candidatus Poseidoniales archaeon]|nr:prefoldin subunit [Candidatus Poseidoniales archaeon]